MLHCYHWYSTTRFPTFQSTRVSRHRYSRPAFSTNVFFRQKVSPGWFWRVKIRAISTPPSCWNKVRCMEWMQNNYKDNYVLRKPQVPSPTISWIWSRFSSRDCRKHKINIYLQPQWPENLLKVNPPNNKVENSNQNQGSWKDSDSGYDICFCDFTADPLRRTVFKAESYTPSEGFLNQLRLPPKWFPTLQRRFSWHLASCEGRCRWIQDAASTLLWWLDIGSHKIDQQWMEESSKCQFLAKD